MCLSNKKINFYTASTERNNFEKVNSKSEQSQSISQVYLLQAAIESFVDGILIMTTQRELLHANECARRICRLLNPGATSSSAVPEKIWRVGQSLIDSLELFPEEKVFIESEINIHKTVKLRIRARWLQPSTSERNFLLVTLEDRNLTSLGMAIADVKKYGLTEREAQVWLLRRANFSYKEIAAKLFITINTVKKHLKNIYAKQQEMLWS